MRTWKGGRGERAGEGWGGGYGAEGVGGIIGRPVKSTLISLQSIAPL